jgi:hypothetical protein
LGRPVAFFLKMDKIQALKRRGNMTRKPRTQCFAYVLFFLCCLLGFAAWVEPSAANGPGAEEKKPQHVLRDLGIAKNMKDPRSASAGGSISGRVTDTSGVGIQNIKVIFTWGQIETHRFYKLTDANGDYLATGFGECTVSIVFDRNGLDYVSQSYPSDVHVYADGNIANIDAQLADAGSISGRVTDASGVGINYFTVYFYNLNNNEIGSVRTDADGNYLASGLPVGAAKVQFHVFWQDLVSEWYNGKSSFAAADPVTVTARSTTPNVNARLAAGGHISGRVTDAAGNGIASLQVRLCDLDKKDLRASLTDASGYYTLLGVSSGSFKVQFFTGYYFAEWYNNKTTFASADPVAAVAGATTPNIDAQLTPGGSIHGQVTDFSGVGIENIHIDFFDQLNDLVKSVQTNADGNYDSDNLMPGPYKVFFYSTDRQRFVPEWYRDKGTLATADPVVVTEGYMTSHIDARLAVPAINSCTVIAPAGGESWTAGTVHQVAWSTTGTIANVKIDYSTDSGSTWALVAGNTANRGSYSWTIPNTPSSRCLVRISDAANAATSDASDAVFSILMNLGLAAERREINAFSIVRQYGQIQFQVQTASDQVSEYRILRRAGSGGFVLLKTVAPSELQNNQFTLQDKYLEKSTLYTYRVEAYDATSQLVGYSAEKTI